MASKDLWWVEQDGYEREHDERLTRKLAQKKMVEVLNAFGNTKHLKETDDWQALPCPFHDDRHASASVNLRKPYFRCHACEVHGNALQLVRTAKGWDEEKAIAWIMTLT